MRHVPPAEFGAIHPGPDPTDGRPALLYRGDVMHQRMRPVGHRFTYGVFSILVDLDRLEEADRLSPLFSVNRANLVSFHEADHILGSDAPTLRTHVDRLLAAEGISEPPARVLLACYPRVFGRVFNPLSVFYALDAAGRPLALLYQVRNTFGENHTYVCPVRSGELSPAGIRQTRRKVFHVSPFLHLGPAYHFRMSLPGPALKWRILETDGDGPLLSATYSARARPLDTAGLLGSILRIPVLAWKVLGAIHFEALRLWLKGVGIVPHTPAPGRTASGENDLRE